MHPRPWQDHLPAGSRVEAADLSVRGTLPRAWARAWADEPEAPLLLEASDPTPRWVTAGELLDRTAAAAGHLTSLGFGPGDRVVWSMSSSMAAVIANLAALRAGLAVVPVNPAYTARELAHVVHDVRPVAVILDDAARAASLESTPAGSPLVLGPSLDPVSGDATARRAVGADVVLDRAAPGDVALVAYTSGTTGSPKGAVLTHANVLANSESIALTWRWEPSDRLVHALPIFHGHGLCVALYTSLLVGASVVLLDHFDVDAVLDASRSYGATLFFGVPTMYHRLAASSRLDELARLRLAVSGSAALRAELHEVLARRAGVSVLERYGMTETLMTLSNPYDGTRRAGTVGFPFPGVEARVEEDGELWVRGPALCAGYWERPAANAEVFEDGWFRTGDLGTVEDGYVRLLGRSTEVIITGGYNVYPAEVEDVLLAHPSVAEVAVAGVASDEWGEVVCAWVVPDGAGAPDEASLLAHAAAGLAPYKRPRAVRFVDSLPRNAMGKVRRSELT